MARARALRAAVAVAIALLASGCVKAGISPKAQEVHGLFYTILWLALPVFIFVEGMLVVCLIWFRRRRGDDSDPVQDPGNNRALTAFFAGPLVIIVILLVVGEKAVADVDNVPAKPPERLVVTGFQWEWSAKYVKEDFVVTGKTFKKPMAMELPVNETTEITLESNDVIHEFYVPDLLFMRNAVPGHPNTFSVKPTKVGTYQARCAQYCGLGHPQMTFTVSVVPRPAFEKWVRQQQTAAAKTGSCRPTGSSVSLVAHHIQWDKTCIAVVAGKPFTVTVKNEDAGIAHNFAIWASAKLKHRYTVTPNVTGPATRTFTLPAMKPGKYYFQCDVHGPAMSGTLVVGRP